MKQTINNPAINSAFGVSVEETEIECCRGHSQFVRTNITVRAKFIWQRLTLV